MGAGTVNEAAQESLKHGVPSYDAPERAALVASGMARYAAIKSKGAGTPISRNAANRKAVEEIFAKVRKDGRSALLGYEAAQVVEAYGVSAAPSRLATSAKEAAAIADSAYRKPSRYTYGSAKL
jgi:acetyltransferase